MKTISVESLSIISFSNIPVVTTELLASLYGTEPDYIRKNFNRNSGRFVIGKHYFLLENEELREFKHSMSLRPSVKIARNVRSLILWTERGAARHAKMLETDRAWEVFEKLWLWDYANRSQALFRELYPALKLIQSGYSGICHDYGYEFSYIIGRARGVLINHTRDIDIYEPDGPTNLLAWERLKNKELPPSLHRY
ncbi:ORF6N domain-containing protein [Escherichia coli]|uniref:ORF6N domain-containing protein n=1 Tax=Escherichia coli TaxID=562 RepID=UPI000859DF0A|nr:ORF6N domain-containing protein [Escherichia coli]